MPVRRADDRALPPRHPGGVPLRAPAGRGAGRRLSGLGPPPPGYRSLTLGDAEWWVAPAAAGHLETAGAADLLAGRARHAAARDEGRGGIRRFRLGGQPAVGKRLLHGGLLGGVTGGLFLGPGRLVEVVGASARLRGAGVATPEVIAIGWRPIAGPCGALALVSAEIDGGRNLLQLLPATRAGSRERQVLLRAAGMMAARLEAAGFVHADLNLANLVASGAPDDLRVSVVDLEGGRFAGAAPRGAGLRRLMRSWEKWVEPRAPGNLRDLVALLRGYTGDRTARRALLRELLDYRDGLGARRLLWRSAGRMAGAR